MGEGTKSERRSEVTNTGMTIAMGGGGTWGSYVEYVKNLEAVANAAHALFPADAGFWDSRRLHHVRAALIKMGFDPAPTVPLCDDLEGLQTPPEVVSPAPPPLLRTPREH